ncbi:transmembrane protein, putative [Bodo saltans]|uniref:Transmembrane protein, putative n=1 Tax=Bodo saltans TaxID=75058 RepID=A0A0S4J1E3_BODSA|nr:transmembrane protein, putative [Bodo saltans]|eukprot:CUG56277.1 transmembrane protein, putative [Bodo saltans]
MNEHSTCCAAANICAYTPNTFFSVMRSNGKKFFAFSAIFVFHPDTLVKAIVFIFVEPFFSPLHHVPFLLDERQFVMDRGSKVKEKLRYLRQTR